MTTRIDWLVLGNVMLGNFLSGVSTRTFLIGLPSVAEGLGTDILGISRAMISFQLASISLAIVFGRLGDIYGRNGIYALGLVTTTASSFLCGMEQNVLQLIVFRFFQGVGSAMTQSAARALAMEAMPPGSVGKAQGLMTLAFHCGFLVGPPLGGLIIDYLNWRWIFFLIVPIGAAAITLTAVRLRGQRAPRRREMRRPLDYAGAGLFVALMVTLIVLLDRRFVERIDAAQMGMLALAFAGMLLGFLVHEYRVTSPIVDLSLFRIRMFTSSILSLLGIAIAYGLVDFLMPFYLQGVLHLTPSFIGVLFLAAPVLTIVLAPLSGHAADRIGPRLPTSLGVIAIIASSGIGALLRIDSHWLLPAAMLAMAGIGAALFNAPNHAAVIGAVASEDRGFATGFIYTIFGLGHMLGISTGTALLTLAFRHYSGIPGATPHPDAPVPFTSSLNVSYLAALLLSLAALCCSLMRGDAESSRRAR